LVALVMGVMSAAFGGIVRDVIAGEPSVLLTREIYVTAAVAGAATFVLLDAVGVAGPVPAVIGTLIGFAVRAGAIGFGWTLPGYRDADPPRAD
jgi:uncharacterized membrane protein YeiH